MRLLTRTVVVALVGWGLVNVVRAWREADEWALAQIADRPPEPWDDEYGGPDPEVVPSGGYVVVGTIEHSA